MPALTRPLGQICSGRIKLSSLIRPENVLLLKGRDADSHECDGLSAVTAALMGCQRQMNDGSTLIGPRCTIRAAYGNDVSP